MDSGPKTAVGGGDANKALKTRTILIGDSFCDESLRYCAMAARKIRDGLIDYSTKHVLAGHDLRKINLAEVAHDLANVELNAAVGHEIGCLIMRFGYMDFVEVLAIIGKTGAMALHLARQKDHYALIRGGADVEEIKKMLREVLGDAAYDIRTETVKLEDLKDFTMPGSGK